jgi:uncharacterized FlaG/YvyC family protein
MDTQMFNSELHALLQEQQKCTVALENCAASALAMQSAVATSDAEASRQRDQLQSVVAKLVEYFERLRVVKVELERLDIVRGLVAGPGAMGWAKKLQKLRHKLAQQQQQQQQQPQQQQQQQQQREEWRQAFRMAPKDLQQQLELSYIENVSGSLVLHVLHGTGGMAEIAEMIICSHCQLTGAHRAGSRMQELRE